MNNHIADNWDYYGNKVSLPYKETVGVGEHAKPVEKKTGAEMIDFLRSEDALMVFSNYQELLAIANVFNISISVFSYGNCEPKWSEIYPDPSMVNTCL